MRESEGNFEMSKNSDSISDGIPKATKDITDMANKINDEIAGLVLTKLKKLDLNTEEFESAILSLLAMISASNINTMAASISSPPEEIFIKFINKLIMALTLDENKRTKNKE